MNTIKIVRVSKMDFLRSYSIWINDKKVGSLKNNNFFTYETAEPNVILQCKIDWCSSKKLSIDFSEELNHHNILVTDSKVNFYLIFTILLIVALKGLFNVQYLAYLVIPFVLLLVYRLLIDRENYITISQID